ncbi:MAG: hypothetical protein ACRDTG_32855 [Pseudonocardiaceae bacterium]
MVEHATDRERRLLQVFGEVLPEATTDDIRDQVDQAEQARDRWLRDNRPPHHDGPV